ncbi:MAG: selenocysteine-specific translation elongation factor [Candidatus Cloacimonetes bacterium]|nr:selenocysteine-specific translation elongation factor [Candidatus Cloacimonadota bacterium]
MESKHLIMGTAGHVDHGKTSLIRALTGYDCDTHLQEKQRGITINLGFTRLSLPSGNTVGIVDVPGHADFINTMVSGACGIDFVLLIISADEGIMPQTREHLQIMELLGIEQGIIVLNKIDLVDEELLELAEEEVYEFVEDTFLATAKVMKVSSLTQAGISELIREIDDYVNKIPQRSAEGFFRMYIDRIFTVEGFGAIVNGSVLSGRVNSNATLYLQPGERQVRIRRIERYGIEAESVQAGDRAALNLVGFKQKEFSRGTLLSENRIKPTNLIDVKIRLFGGDRQLGIWNQVVFLMGTVKQMVRLHLLDQDELVGGEQGLAQVYLPRAIVPVMGDKFIIRLSSGDLTLGGGEIIDPYPLHHRRRRQQQIEIVKKLSSGDLAEIIAAEVRKSMLPVSLTQIAEMMNQKVDALTESVYSSLAGDIAFFQSEKQIILLMTKLKTAYKNKVLNSIRLFKQQNPLSEEGRSFQELLGIFGEDRNDITRETLTMLLEEMETDVQLRKAGKTWVLYNHIVELDPEFNRKIQAVMNYLLSCGNNVPLMAGINEAAGAEGIEEKELKLILQQLTRQEEIIHYQNSYIHSQVVKLAQAKLTSFLKQHEEGITLAQFRDIMQTNRKMAALLLDYFDKKNLTVRRNDVRYFTTQYKRYLES